MKKSDINNRKSIGLQKPGVIIPAPAALIDMPKGYESFLKNLKERIISERLKSVLSANTAMIMLYWEIGQSILSRQQSEGWGAKIIDRLSHDLKTAFPDMSGFSPRNLKYMRKFAQAWPDKEIVQRTVAQIPWRSNLTLLGEFTVVSIVIAKCGIMYIYSFTAVIRHRIETLCPWENICVAPPG